MRLTTFSDYALRVLIYLGAAPRRLATIDEIAVAYQVSANHLMKVVHQLGRLGYIDTVRGKGGGMRLARPPAEIVVGEVLRATEDSLVLVECFGEGEPDCVIAGTCVLKGALGEALEAFLGVLDSYTLEDLVRPVRPPALATVKVAARASNRARKVDSHRP